MKPKTVSKTKKTVAKKVNKTKPGLPNYSGPNRGVFLLIHHDTIVEVSEGIRDRVAYIKKKPPHEVKTRLDSLTYVPPEHLPKKIAKLLPEFLADVKGHHDALWGAVEEWSRTPNAKKLLDKLVPNNTWNDGEMEFPDEN